MILLSLDLGKTTGWAVLVMQTSVESIRVVEHGTMTEVKLKGEFEFLKDAWMPNQVIMEKPVLEGRGPLADSLRNVVTLAEAAFPIHSSITPAQWKPSPLSSYPLPRGTSPHVRDAVRMGVWWLKSAFASDNVGH